MAVSPSSLESLLTLCIGLALSGLLASSFELFTAQRASFRLLEAGGVSAIAALPMLAFTAPFIILRNTVRGRRIERRPMPFVMVATMPDVRAGGARSRASRYRLNALTPVLATRGPRRCALGRRRDVILSVRGGDR